MCGDGVDQDCDGLDLDCSRRFVEIGQPLGLNDAHTGRGAAFVDFDGDGDLDLHVVNFSSARDYLWRNDVETGNNWIAVRPLLSLPGGLSRDAIGAMVWIDFDGNGDFLPASEGGGGIFMQEVSAGFNQSAFGLHFGLGSWPGPVAVRIRFPGPGTLAERTVVMTGVEVNRRIEAVR